MSSPASPIGESASQRAVASANLRSARALHASRRWAEAAYRYRRAFEDDGNCFEAVLGLGVSLLELGRLEEAVATLRQAIGLDGASFDAYAALALALDRLMQWQACVAAYERALTLRPADRQTLLKLGFALSRLDRRAELTARLETAIAVDPEAAELHGMLASQFFAFGRIDEAVAAMDAMLALEPANGFALALLSDMKTFTPGDPHFLALENAARTGSARSDDERCAVRYALGKAYADLGRHEESFREYLEANRLRRRTFRYDVGHAIGGLERLKAIFTPDLMRARRGMGAPSDRPVFIVGFMRSGTTLVEQILASHPRVYGLGESPDVRTAVQEVLSSYPEQVPWLTGGDLRRIGETYLRRVEGGAGEAVRIIDKTLSNDLFAGLLHLALPQARFIHVVRDPVDTCLSVFATNLGAAYPYSNDLYELGRYYRAERELMAHWRKLLPEDAFLEVSYESVVADIAGETRRLLRFCGVEWDDACLAFNSSRRAVWTASAAQIRRPLYASSVGRWRPAPEDLGPLLEGLGIGSAPAI
ncbi:MAG TPA: sulfotransferase [Rhizomicrobium sp.]|nr:sulfotransferase [Rhizomicrobium sp.]